MKKLIEPLIMRRKMHENYYLKENSEEKEVYDYI